MEVLAFADATDATAVTVIDSFLLVFVVVEAANLTVVLGKILLAFYARLGLDLFGLAPEAFYVRHLVSVHLMILLGIHFVLKEQFVMAQSTGEEGACADWVWALQLASTQIVLAPEVV